MRDNPTNDWLAFRPVAAHVQNSSLSTAVTITVPSGALGWMVQVQTQNVRFTLDGTTATTSKGFQLKPGDPPQIFSVYPGQTISVIEETTTAVMDYQFGGNIA